MVEAVFLDRDGVINEEVEYLHDPKDLVLISGAASAIKRLNDAGVPVVVVTNQAGVARGLYSEEKVVVLHDALQKELSKEGARIDAFYYCPHHSSAGVGGYKIDCDCRKPMPGLLLRAAKDLDLDLTQCVFVGDKASDIGAGVAAGCRTILVTTGYGEKEWASWNEKYTPDHVAADLSAAVEWLLRE